MKKLLFVLFAFVMIVSCGGGSSSSSSDTKPSGPDITDVVLFRVDGNVLTETYDFNSGDAVTFDLYCSNPLKNNASLHISYFTPDDSDIEFMEPDTLSIDDNRWADMIYMLNPPIVLDIPRGDWRVDFYVVSNNGLESNTYSVYFVVK
jgi:hypothetical protein